MAEITAAMVKELREKTDAPMMECKRALTEAGGDMARAEEILRVKLGSKASKAAGRVTAEGLIGLYISPDAKQGAVKNQFLNHVRYNSTQRHEDTKTQIKREGSEGKISLFLCYYPITLMILFRLNLIKLINPMVKPLIERGNKEIHRLGTHRLSSI